jgi:hypothetical protein
MHGGMGNDNAQLQVVPFSVTEGRTSSASGWEIRIGI